MKEKFKNSLKAKLLGQYTGTDNKQRSLIILIIGFSVLIALFIMGRINYFNNRNSNNNNNNNYSENKKNIKFLSLEQIFNNYLDNYNYSITIEDETTSIKYEGTCSSGTNTGKKIVGEEVIDYHIANDIVIDLKTNKEIDDLYGDYLSYYFNPTNVYEFIKDKENSEEIVDNEKIYTYNSIYNDGDIMFRIATTKDGIDTINYKYKEINYSIKFD